MTHSCENYVHLMIQYLYVKDGDPVPHSELGPSHLYWLQAFQVGIAATFSLRSFFLSHMYWLQAFHIGIAATFSLRSFFPFHVYWLQAFQVGIAAPLSLCSFIPSHVYWLPARGLPKDVVYLG
jgi:hypothetical protein